MIQRYLYSAGTISFPNVEYCMTTWEQAKNLAGKWVKVLGGNITLMLNGAGEILFVMTDEVDSGKDIKSRVVTHAHIQLPPGSTEKIFQTVRIPECWIFGAPGFRVSKYDGTQCSVQGYFTYSISLDDSPQEQKQEKPCGLIDWIRGDCYGR